VHVITSSESKKNTSSLTEVYRNCRVAELSHDPDFRRREEIGQQYDCFDCLSHVNKRALVLKLEFHDLWEGTNHHICFGATRLRGIRLAEKSDQRQLARSTLYTYNSLWEGTCHIAWVAEKRQSQCGCKLPIDFKAFEHRRLVSHLYFPSKIYHISVLPTNRAVIQLSTIISRCDNMCMLVSLDTDVFEIANIWAFERRELALIISERR
jgi:hypothetical protein